MSPPVARLSLIQARAEAFRPRHRVRRSGGRPARIIEHDGCRLTITEWAEKLGISRFTIYNRLNHGMSVADALSDAPIKRGRPPVAHPRVGPWSAEGASVADLRAWAKMLPGGTAYFLTSLAGSTLHRPHVHRAVTDARGDGHTLEDESGHGHEVRGFVVIGEDHQHGMDLP